MRKIVLTLLCSSMVAGFFVLQAAAERPTRAMDLLAKYLGTTPAEWRAMPRADKKAAISAIGREARSRFREELKLLRAARPSDAQTRTGAVQKRSKVAGTIQYDTGPMVGAYITGGFKGNRFDVAPNTSTGAVVPIQAPGTITQVSAYVVEAPPPGSPSWTWTYDAEFRILGAASGGAAGGTAPVLLNSTSGSGPITGTQVRALASPVTFPGPSFHVGVQDTSGWSWSTTTTWTSTSMSTWTSTFTSTITNTFPTTPTGTMTYTTMSYPTWTSMYTSTWTYTYTDTYNYGYIYAAPAYVTATTNSQGFHAVAFDAANPANVAPIAGRNMMVRASGNVLVPVELMRFLVE